MWRFFFWSLELVVQKGTALPLEFKSETKQRVLQMNYRVWERAKLSQVLVATINLSVHYEASTLIFYSPITSKHERQPNKKRLNIFHISAVSLWLPTKKWQCVFGTSVWDSASSLGTPGVRKLSLVLSRCQQWSLYPFQVSDDMVYSSEVQVFAPQGCGVMQIWQEGNHHIHHYSFRTLLTLQNCCPLWNAKCLWESIIY